MWMGVCLMPHSFVFFFLWGEITQMTQIFIVLWQSILHGALEAEGR